MAKKHLLQGVRNDNMLYFCTVHKRIHDYEKDILNYPLDAFSRYDALLRGQD